MSKELNIKAFAHQIAEQGDYESVLIIVTGFDPNDNNTCITSFSMTGNVYASIGVAREFVIKQEEYTRIAARQSMQEDDGQWN